ncbi:uncharacterized protein F5891DRAFT_976553 [Suillus fuscotomentosus]|uniref:Uncharacterized protein n=1 Tax=Suillus fuscotomentosus TaxID=1912939 RepID=A0AAD4EEW4_9AGAM|nr:uncharacterized protein F5891DRAFT_976553 [Suillus fuscotomentosus]KAG1904974.1 hypothetical protein F5891DRAFT_976553 [Suillus fuscotomentosus]
MPVPHSDVIQLHIQSDWDTLFCKQSKIVFSKQLLRSGDLVCLNTPDLVRQICMILMADHAFGGSAKLAFDLDSQCKEVKDRLRDVELVFRSRTQEQVEVSKYYLECHLINHTLQIHMSISTYVNPPQESKSIKIGDFLLVLVRDWIGKSGVVQWVSNSLMWFQDEMSSPYFIQIEAIMVECTCLPATLKFTKECSYNVRPEDVISIAYGPKFYTEGVVHSMDFINSQLTLETDNKEYVTVSIRFIMKTHNIDLDVFNKYMKKEVFVIGGPKKGFWAMLYNLSMDTCIIAIHSQPCITVRCSDVATKKSYVMAPPQSVTISLERITPSALASSSAITWETRFPEVLATISFQNDNANSICWLKAHVSQFHNYHALFNGLVSFQGSKLLKQLVYSHCPDSFCGPNGPAPPGHILAWATAKTAGGARVDYQIPVECLTLAQPQKKNQECFIMDGQN